MEEIRKQIRESIANQKRISIEVESEPARWGKFSTGKIIELTDLSPDFLPVAYLGDKGNNKFVTIVNLGGYKFGELNGLVAIEKFLNENKTFTLKKDDSHDEERNLPKIKIKSVKVESNPYIPTVSIFKSPYQFQVLIPATSVPAVLEIITSLYDNWFSKVRGKLPLKVGVLAANRKFPLYVLMDSASRMLEGEGFKKTIPMEPYWGGTGQRIDPYYGFYPTDEDVSPEKLEPVKNGRRFYLDPGYFDFDFLGGTADRGRIFYQREDSKFKRKTIKYGWIEPRPHHFHRIKDMLKLRDILGRLSKTQINGIEQALITKLDEWNFPPASGRSKIFHEFAKAVLIDAFTQEKWEKMISEDREFIKDAVNTGLLLDTIQLFNHVLKVKIGGDER